MLDDVETDDLIKIALLLLIVWLAVEVVNAFLFSVLDLLGPLRPIAGLLILAAIAYWLYERL